MVRFIDIREQAHLSGENVKKLTFINSRTPYVFRKFYRQGLRSHIFEVLLEKDVEAETTGLLVNGIKKFPRATPIKMFRIFRTRFQHIDEIFKEIRKYHLLLENLGKDHIALSEEFIADYTESKKHRMLLCGLQEYVTGEILDPWQILTKEYLEAVYPSSQKPSAKIPTALKAKQQVADFISRVKQMMERNRFIPDLAGVGNLILTPSGNIKLVDINNIVEFDRSSSILLDDKGYPSCDVSVQVLAILEEKLLNRTISTSDAFYYPFLLKKRLKAVRHLEKKFYIKMKHQK